MSGAEGQRRKSEWVDLHLHSYVRCGVDFTFYVTSFHGQSKVKMTFRLPTVSFQNQKILSVWFSLSSEHAADMNVRCKGTRSSQVSIRSATITKWFSE